MGTVRDAEPSCDEAIENSSDVKDVGKLHHLLDLLMSLGEIENEETSDNSQEDLSHRSESERSAEAPVKVHSGVPGGPCAHCGVCVSPQWRRPRSKKGIYCNACGIYFARHKTLPSLHWMVRKDTPVPKFLKTSLKTNSRGCNKRFTPGCSETASRLEAVTPEAQAYLEIPRRTAKRGKVGRPENEDVGAALASVSSNRHSSFHMLLSAVQPVELPVAPALPAECAAHSPVATGSTSTMCSFLCDDMIAKQANLHGDYVQQNVVLLPKRCTSGPKIKLVEQSCNLSASQNYP